MKVQLSQKAPWNFRLGNPYRTRWAEVNGRYFKVSAEHLNAIWEIEEVDYDGHALVLRRPQKGEDQFDPKNYEFGYSDFALTLAQAREKIAEEVRSSELDPLPWAFREAGSNVRADTRSGFEPKYVFDPRSGYEQDRAKYYPKETP